MKYYFYVAKYQEGRVSGICEAKTKQTPIQIHKIIRNEVAEDENVDVSTVYLETFHLIR